MTTDFRALCAELVEKLDEFDRLLHGAQYVEHPLTYRARDARRPKPPSLKEQALQAMCRFMDSEGHDGLTPEEVSEDFCLIRRALEALPDDCLTPNDLSHMSDEDFNALCPQGHHALGAEPLSPAAQAVRDAVLATYDESIPKDDNLWVLERASVVAALRAVADQVVPESIVYIPTSDGTMRRVDELWIVRRGVYAIAAELEALPDD